MSYIDDLKAFEEVQEVESNFKAYCVYKEELDALDRISKRLATLDRLSGDEMSEMAKRIASIIDDSRRMPVR